MANIFVIKVLVLLQIAYLEQDFAYFGSRFFHDEVQVVSYERGSHYPHRGSFGNHLNSSRFDTVTPFFNLAYQNILVATEPLSST